MPAPLSPSHCVCAAQRAQDRGAGGEGHGGEGDPASAPARAWLKVLPQTPEEESAGVLCFSSSPDEDIKVLWDEAFVYNLI